MSPLLHSLPTPHNQAMSKASFIITTTFLFLISLRSASPLQSSTASIHPSPATIPAFPEQSALSSACPLHLPPAIFPALRHSCSYPLHRSRCCPTLSAWLYSAYSPTALSTPLTSSQPYDLPVPPDDSETCVGSLERAMEDSGVKLARPNETCDLVYCYCGIRLHPLRCPAEVVERVGELESECSGGGIAGCNKCLNGVQQLKENKYGKTNKTQERAKEMQNKDCELMGLTWLLAKNRSAYIHTVTSVLQALMMNKDGHNGPRSCTLDSDGLPMAVDSSEINGRSSSATFGISISVVSLFLLYLSSPLF